jgi:hypothetical protein
MPERAGRATVSKVTIPEREIDTNTLLKVIGWFIIMVWALGGFILGLTGGWLLWN